MNAFRRLRDYVVFTRNEQVIILVLSVVLLAGAGIKAYRAMTTPQTAAPFDYARSDSVFAARSAAIPGAADTAGARVNLNTAGRTQFMTLPGIGPVLADRMLTWRNTHGRFRHVNDVKKIAGIGAKKFERLRSMIEVRPDTGR